MWIDACRPKTLVAAFVPVVMGGLVFWIYGDKLHQGAQKDYLFTFFPVWVLPYQPKYSVIFLMILEMLYAEQIT
jgi:hypothetical protein